jgi:hypothetical protein
MLSLVETKISCPKDGFSMFAIRRDADVGVSDTVTLEYVCRACDPRLYNEILRNARKIVLLSDREPAQRLKLK